MRYSFTTSLLLFTVLLLGLSCRDSVQVQPDPVKPLPPINLATCRIVKATYKTIYYYGSKLDYEQLNINGKTYDIYKDHETVYTYDNQGRLSHEFDKNQRSSENILYTYNSTNLLIETTITNDGIITQTDRKVIPLNSSGYDDRYEYNPQGRLLYHKRPVQTSKAEYLNNNLLYETIAHDGGTIKTVYTYDLTRPALPRIYQFMGLGSQNLLTRHTFESAGIAIYTDGPVFSVDYSYKYDGYGRVKRQIQLDKEYPDSRWPYGTNIGGIGATDYEYECP